MTQYILTCSLARSEGLLFKSLTFFTPVDFWFDEVLNRNCMLQYKAASSEVNRTAKYGCCRNNSGPLKLVKVIRRPTIVENLGVLIKASYWYLSLYRVFPSHRLKLKDRMRSAAQTYIYHCDIVVQHGPLHPCRIDA